MTIVLKQSNPDANPKAFDILKEEVISVINEEIVVSGVFNEMMYPLYGNHFTEAELKKLIEINNTEIGKKVIRVMPIITQEGMIVGQQFGQSLAPKIQQRITERFEQEGISLR